MSEDSFLKLVAARLDPDVIIDVLGWSSSRLVLKLRKDILENEEQFRDEMGAYGENEDFYE